MESVTFSTQDTNFMASQIQEMKSFLKISGMKLVQDGDVKGSVCTLKNH
jgi:hypothetical protein